MTLAVRAEKRPWEKPWWDDRIRREDIELRMRLDRAIADAAWSIRYHRTALRHATSIVALNRHEEGERCARLLYRQMKHIRDGKFPPERDDA